MQLACPNSYSSRKKINLLILISYTEQPTLPAISQPVAGTSFYTTLQILSLLNPALPIGKQHDKNHSCQNTNSPQGSKNIVPFNWDDTTRVRPGGVELQPFSDARKPVG
jgi:hypothetical protein